MSYKVIKKQLLEKKRFEFTDFLDLIALLRSPEGCAWDRKQTALSMRKDLLEETYEVIDAIDNQDIPNLREELGDLILTSLMICQISKEDNHFSISDVITEVCTKLIRRHPHVFGDEIEVNDSNEVLSLWNEIKDKEKQNSQSMAMNDSGILHKISKNLPPLERAYQIQKKVQKVGFDWDNHQQVISKIQEEAVELGEALESSDQAHIEEEMGDLLFSVVNLSRFLKIDPAIALNKTNNKFKKRFEYVESKMEEIDQPLSKENMKQMDQFWNEAKNHD